MRERINRLAKGIVDMDTPELSVVPESVTEAVQAGEVTKRELYVTDVQGRFIKGLVYSSSTRVRIQNNSFGGNRNHVAYEIDGRYLTGGDVVTGSFYLVTNGGEKKVPYTFTIEAGASGKTLESLKTAKDFAELAKKDQELALRLFEYRDFTEAPFMQELHVRALYDGLKGRIDRQNQLEEFLVALKVKEPVSLKIDKEVRQYEKLTAPVQDTLSVSAQNWGYIQFEVSVDGEFLELPRKSFSLRDFQDGVCRVPYVVNPGHLHGGRNLGALLLRTVRDSCAVPVEVQAEEASERSVPEAKEGIHRYLRLRLDYETGVYEDRLLINQMRQELERMRKEEGESLSLSLRSAELYLLDGQKERAETVLDSCRDEAMKSKQDDHLLYCFYQYLSYLIRKKTGQRDILLRLVRQYLVEEPTNAGLYMLRLKLEPSIRENPEEFLGEMKEMFRQGCHSPYLYSEAWRIYAKDPGELRRIEEFELQVMNFAVRKELVERELALRLSELAGAVKHYHRLYYRLLAALYEKYPEKQILTGICSLLIKGDCRDVSYFPWYQKALEEQVSLTRLYEYFLYSVPRDYPKLFPKEILLYFSYEKELDDYSRSLLYMNIVKYMKPEAALYKQYAREIEQFAMEQLLKARINRRFVVLYEHMIYKEMIDEKVARVLPSILKSYRIRVENPDMRYVIVCYEETDGEDAFPIKEGVAYVPLFSEHPVILFQDHYGNRYYNIPHQKLPAMEQEGIRELEARCYEVYPRHPMLRIQECAEVVSRGILEEEDLTVLKRSSAELKLRPLFERRILACVIDYYRKCLENEDGSAGGDIGYFLELDPAALTRQERAGVCETLIQEDYIREAYEIVHTYGAEGIKSSRLLKLCTRMVLQRLFDEDETLLQLSCFLFSEGRYDSVLLDYLCEHFNGSTRQMYKILSQGLRDHVEVYDMPERLLAQMMFTGEDDRIDQVFDWYAGGRKTGDSVIRAYFTLKSTEYFVKERAVDDKVFAYLETVVHGIQDKSRIPTIYLLALTRYYSTLKSLDEERKTLCRDMVFFLLEEGRLFAYFKDLGRLIDMPASVMDKVIIEYRCSRDSRPELRVRVLPEEEIYHSEEMQKVYPGIYVRQKVLFEGEILEYRIYEREEEQWKLKKEDSLACELASKQEQGSRFAALNEMGLCLSVKEEQGFREKMKKYLVDNALMEELFGLM